MYIPSDLLERITLVGRPLTSVAIFLNNLSSFKDTLKFLEELHKNHIVDTALFENVSAVAHFW